MKIDVELNEKMLCGNFKLKKLELTDEIFMTQKPTTTKNFFKQFPLFIQSFKNETPR